MCCEFILKYFRDYEDIEDLCKESYYFDKAIKILNKNEPGLILYYTSNGNVTFSDRFIRWYNSLPEPFFVFISNFEIVKATCEIKQLFYMGKLKREDHHLFFILITNYYGN
uniref:Uncharacterized protein n=1 Tax=viral metagenome TaxID=1070528 RepID=A0A6C0DK88_9ZZZZ